MEGGREISRTVDLETIPLYVRAGSILPLGPVQQHVYEASGEPVTICLYPGSEASFFLYEDDGKSFDYRTGDWMGVQMSWNDAQRTLNISLPDGARMLPPLRRNLEIKLEQTKRQVEFTGKPLKVQL